MRALKVVDLGTASWRARIGHVETVLSYFGSTFAVEVERADGVEVYVQGRREGASIEIEATGNQFLPDPARLSAEVVEQMAVLGWEPPVDGNGPNFTMTIHHPEAVGTHELAVLLTRTLGVVYGVAPEDEWSVRPTEFGNRSSSINEEGLFEIFGEGPVMNWGWKSASAYAAIPRSFHEVIFETMRAGGTRVRSGPYRDGTVGALGLPNVVGAELMSAAGVVFLRSTYDFLRLRLTRDDADRAVADVDSRYAVDVVGYGEVLDATSDAHVELVLARLDSSEEEAAAAWVAWALGLALRAMKSAVTAR